MWRYGLTEKEPGRFYVLPRRWVGWTAHGPERAFAWLGQARRLSKDFSAAKRLQQPRRAPQDQPWPVTTRSG